jgi:hypothetical protein
MAKEQIDKEKMSRVAGEQQAQRK